MNTWITDGLWKSLVVNFGKLMDRLDKCFSTQTYNALHISAEVYAHTYTHYTQYDIADVETF